MKQMLRDMKRNTLISISRDLIITALLACLSFLLTKEELIQQIGLTPLDSSLDPVGIALSAILLLFTFSRLGLALSGLYQRQARKFISQLDMGEKEQIAHDYQSAWRASHLIKIGRLYTFTNDLSTHIYSNKDIIWIYLAHKEYRGHTTYYLRFYTLNEAEPATDRIGKKIYPKVLDYYTKNFPHIVVGFSKDLDRCYRSDRNQFLQLRYYNSEHRPEELFLNEK